MLNDASLSSLQLLHKTAQMFKQNVTSQAQITGTPVYSKVKMQGVLRQSLSTFFQIVRTFNFYLKACTLRSSQHNTLKLHQC